MSVAIAPSFDSGRDDREKLRPHLFTAEDFCAMMDAGILTNEDRVELIHGSIVEMSPIHLPHGVMVSRIHSFLARNLSDDLGFVINQSSLKTSKESVPAADICVAKSEVNKLSGKILSSDMAIWVIEVSDSTLKHDRDKAELYAAAGIKEYWIVDINGRCVEVRTGIARGAYSNVKIVPATEMLASAEFPSVIFDLKKLFA